MLQILRTTRDNTTHAMLIPASSDGMINIHDLERNRCYDVSCYQKLDRMSSPNAWTEVFGPANDFLMMLNDAEAERFETTYREARDTLAQHRRTGVVGVAPLYALIDELDLIARLIRFVSDHRERFNLPQLSVPPNETLAYGVEKLTFQRHEYIGLIAISVLCKLFVPLWGCVSAQMNRTDRPYADVVSRSMTLLKPLLKDGPLLPVYEKLRVYVDKVVMHELRYCSAPRIDQLFVDGWNLSRMVDYITEMLLVKRYANVDLCKPDGNILVWTGTNARLSFTSLLGTLEMNRSRVT